MGLKDIGWEGVDWIYLAKEKWWTVVNTVLDRSVSLNAENFFTSWGTISFWTTALWSYFFFPKVRTCCFSPKVTSLGFNVLDSSNSGSRITWLKVVWRHIIHREGNKCVGLLKVANILELVRPCRSAFVLDASIHLRVGAHFCSYVIMCTFVHMNDTTDREKFLY